MKPDFAALMQQCHTPPETWDIAQYTRLVLEEAAKVVDHILKEGGGTYGDAIRILKP